MISDEIVLSVRNLRKSFGGLQALKGVDIDVPKNSITGLIGPNGCGKSTTFNTISGLLPYDEGTVTIFGKDATGLPSHKINKLGLSRTFQNTRLWRNLTVIENLLLPPKNQRGTSLKNLFSSLSWRKQENELIEKAFEILELLEISHMAYSFASELSGGQSKLVDIGRVLMSDPKILLLDEPVAGVAGPLAEKIFHHLDRLRKEKDMTIVIIEHNLEFILREGVDKIYVMNLGEILASGTPDEILKEKAVIEAYLGG